MIRASDLQSAYRLTTTTTVPVWRSENRSTISWFDSNAFGAPKPIIGDVSFTSRSLTVEEHTTRILSHLRGEREALA